MFAFKGLRVSAIHPPIIPSPLAVQSTPKEEMGRKYTVRSVQGGILKFSKAQAVQVRQIELVSLKS